MWFKNLMIYHITEPVEKVINELVELLPEQHYTACGSHTPASFGWFPPMGHQQPEIAITSNGYTLICARKEEKILPASVVKEAVDERVQKLEDQGQKVFKKQKQAIKDDVIQNLLPQAFSKKKDIYGYFSSKDQMLILDCSSASVADEWITLFQQTLGRLPLKAVEVPDTMKQTLTKWMTDGFPEGLTRGQECELHGTQEEGIIRCQKHDLHSDEIMTHLTSGKQVVQLAIQWQEQLQFVLNHELIFKKIKFLETKEESADLDDQDFSSIFLSDFSIMTLTLSQCINDIFSILKISTEHTTENDAETSEVAEAAV